MNNLWIECKHCLTLWNIVGTIDDKLKRRLLINPLTSICYLCEKVSGLPPILNNLWEFDKKVKKWRKIEITN